MTFQDSLFFAVPAFVLLIAIEYGASLYMKKNVYPSFEDVVSSLSSGLANITFAAIGFIFVLAPYNWFVENYAIFHVPADSWIAWVVVILCKDFSAYWFHRWTHRVNSLWQLHLIHHSSEEYNLPVALRQSTNGFVNYASVALIPAALIGIPFEMVAIIGFVHLFYQYWYHTRLIGDLGWLEYIIVTPQQHSIHHSMNKEYIDTNFGAWFSIWDQMFGTFQLKIPGVEQVYGITHPVKTWNPIKIDYMLWAKMLRDTLHTKKWSDKLKIWYAPTNWRPEDVKEKFPSERVGDVYRLEKYQPKTSRALKVWSFLELNAATLLIMLYFLALPQLSVFHSYLFGGFALFNVWTYTTVMEGQKQALLPVARLVLFTCMITFANTPITHFEWLWFIDFVFVSFYAVGILSAWLFSFPEEASDEKQTESVTTS
ncbi:sterol desaturase family protein [Veronia nyctiphanis]|nr:sterol desaturase family protein [Veronia nyctiphanis]